MDDHRTWNPGDPIVTADDLNDRNDQPLPRRRARDLFLQALGLPLAAAIAAAPILLLMLIASGCSDWSWLTDP